MNCPHCDFRFRILAVSGKSPRGQELPELAPILCQQCLEVSVLLNGEVIRKPTAPELDAIRASPAWSQVIVPAREILQRARLAANARNN